MKKVSLVLAGLTLLLLSVAANAQSKTGADYFEGKWSVLLKNLPQGDTKMIIVLQKKDTTVTGVVQDSTGKEITKIDKAELAGTSVTVYFNTQGYDVNIVMTKKDEDHITGSLMGMFEAEGERMKANN